jgi:REP element-mobilizing transposase RayT
MCTGGRSSISKAVGYIKMNASKAIRMEYGSVNVWQRGFYDHIIRNRDDYANIAEYIEENVLRWHLDVLNPEAILNIE